MKYCKFCGKQISDYADICMHCGRYQNKKEIPDDAPSTGIAILSFIFPVLGFILWLVWKPTLPLRAKSAGKAALIGIILVLVLWLLISCTIFGLFAVSCRMRRERLIRPTKTCKFNILQDTCRPDKRSASGNFNV